MIEHSCTELWIPMRDGARLQAFLYRSHELAGPAPVLLLRSPYRNDEAEFERLGLGRYTGSGMAVVYQLVRGRAPSEGEFDFFFNEEADGADTIAWIARQSWCNGDVATDGGSFLGTVQYLAARSRPEALRVIMPSVPAGDFFFEIPYHGGGLQLDHLVNWNAMQNGVDVEAREDEITELMRSVRPLTDLGARLGITSRYFYDALDRESYAPRLQALQFKEDDFRAIARIPLLTVTGWFDGDQAGALFYWDGVQRHHQADSYLIIGPWNHGACYLGQEDPKQGGFSFGETARIDIGDLRLRFLQRFFLGDAEVEWDQPRVSLFVTGVNEWRSYDEYPPPSRRECLFLRGHGPANSAAGVGQLSTVAPAAETPDRYVYEPDDPVTYQQYGEDVSAAEQREDMLIYGSCELAGGVEVIGPIELELYASSDAPDTDFVARLIDVHPDGRALNLTHGRGVLRARFRNDMIEEVPLRPGQVECFRLRLNDVGHVFRPGHRIRLEVTSSMFPLVDPNPNTGASWLDAAPGRPAEQAVYHDQRHASRLVLPVTSGREFLR